MVIQLRFVFLCFVATSIGGQGDFFYALRTEFSKHNTGVLSGVFSCGHVVPGKLTLLCDNGLLAEMRLSDCILESFHATISSVSASLFSITVDNVSLKDFGSSFGSLTNLRHLHLSKLTILPPSSFSSFTQLRYLALASFSLTEIPNWISSFDSLSLLNLNGNKLTSLPHFISSFTKLTSLNLYDNSFSTNLDELDSLTLLRHLNLGKNPSIRASTDLFKKMVKLTFLNISNTLISGSKLDHIYSFDCSSTCVSSVECSPKTESCSCNVYSSECPLDRCGVTAKRLCVDCSTLVSQKQCSGDCNWCSEKKNDLDCYWCESKKSGCEDSSNCNVCTGYLTSKQCVDSGCHWCDYEYCTVNAEECESVCSNLSEERCALLDCSWCSSYETCLDSTTQCLACDRFNSSFCPSGCNCPSDSDEESSLTLIIVICVICCIVFLLCCFLFVFFVLKMRTTFQSNEMKSISNSNKPLRFEEEEELTELTKHPIVSKYAECSIDSLFRISQEILTFHSNDSLLKLCSPVSATFELTNICGMELVVECLFVRGFKEKHEFVFSPSSFTIGKNEKRKICVELTMKCSAILSPSRSLICCGVSTKQQWCSLCGIQAQSELSPLLSCDDIELNRELGRGAFGKVYLGSFKGTEVAIKKYSSFTKEDNEKEANMFSKLHSPHIVIFYGISQTLNAMIIEYCKYGSVEGLYDRKEMTDKLRMLICYDCSLGMKYLHSNGIIHRDLKPDNLLIVSFSKDVNTVRAKISDFGTSRFGNQTMKMTESVGTPAYMAPEVFNNESYGKKSDVYSFGLTVWSIFAKQDPYSELANVQIILKQVNEGYRPQLRQDCPLNELIQRCWKINPNDRPSFDEIAELLKQ